MDQEKEKQEEVKTKQKELFRLLFNTSKHSMVQQSMGIIILGALIPSALP